MKHVKNISVCKAQDDSVAELIEQIIAFVEELLKK